jgi:hypothetical protein
MAVVNRNTLVLKGVCVVRDVVTGTMGIGLNTAQPLANPFSMRRQSQRYPVTVQETDPRHDLVAERAGRPGCVLASRSPALGAGRTVLRGWSLARGRACSMAAWRFGRFTARPSASADRTLPGRLLALRGLASGTAIRAEARKHAKASLAWLKPAGGALAASTRG